MLIYGLVLNFSQHAVAQMHLQSFLNPLTLIREETAFFARLKKSLLGHQNLRKLLAAFVAQAEFYLALVELVLVLLVLYPPIFLLVKNILLLL